MRVWLLLLLFCAPSAFAAELSGTAYTHTLDVASYAVLTINTTPVQRLILEDGTYNISVPKGKYELRVVMKNGQTILEDELLVHVVDDRSYTYDLILFPSQGNASEEELPVIDDLSIPDLPAPSRSLALRYSLGALLLLGLIAMVIWFAPRRWWTTYRVTSSTDGLPADLTGILTFLRKEGGRSTQKELRKNFPYSEAKISAMLTDLESRGKIRRVKQGRSNVIVLK